VRLHNPANPDFHAAQATSADVTRLGGYPKWVNDCILSPDDLAARNFDRVIFGWDCG